MCYERFTHANHSACLRGARGVQAARCRPRHGACSPGPDADLQRGQQILPFVRAAASSHTTLYEADCFC